MISLVKGQTIDLRKNASGGSHNLSQVTIGLGWKMSERGGTFDLDAAAILLDKNGKIAANDDVVYFGNKKHKSKQIWSTGDNLTGEGAGDDEQIIVKLDSIEPQYERIVFFTTIYQGRSKGQSFGDVKEAYIRAVDAGNSEIAKFNISADSSLSNKCSFIFGEAYRKDGTWKFRALGDAHEADSISMICEKYK